MELHQTHLSGIPFFAFAAVLVAAGIASVTVADARRRALSFFLFTLTLGGVMFLEAGPAPGLAMALLGLVSALFFWRKSSQTNPTSAKQKNHIAVEEGPNRPVAFFITLCLIMVLTPIWGYSIWRGHQVDELSTTTPALWTSLTGANVALTLAIVTLAIVIVVSLSALKAAIPAAQSSNENQSQADVSS